MALDVELVACSTIMTLLLSLYMMQVLVVIAIHGVKASQHCMLLASVFPKHTEASYSRHS